jgi:cytochrome c oxidase cbb3-type subunit IV
MDIGTFRGLVTALLMLLFVWLVAWAYSRRRHADFTAAAALPLEDDTAPPPTRTPPKDGDDSP